MRGERGAQRARFRKRERESPGLHSATGDMPRTFCTGLFGENMFLFVMKLTFLSASLPSYCLQESPPDC